MTKNFFRKGLTGLTAGLLAAFATATAAAESPDFLYQRFLSQQMMVAKIKEFNNDPAASSLKASLAKEAKAAGMTIPDWFHTNTRKPGSRSSIQPIRGEIERYIQNASAKYGVSPALIKAVIRVESAFKADAVSRAGAKGLMQIMDATGAEIGLTDPFDPRANIYGGTRLLKTYLVRYQSVKKTLIAYNAGEKYVDYPHARLPRETQNYIPQVIKHYHVYAGEYARENNTN